MMTVATDRIPFTEMDPGDDNTASDAILKSKFSQELKALEEIFKEFSSIIQDDEKENEKQNETTEKENENNYLNVSNDQKDPASRSCLEGTKEKKELHVESNLLSEEYCGDRMEGAYDNFFSVSSYEQISFDKDRYYSSELDDDDDIHDNVQSLSDLLKQPLDQLMMRVHSDDDDDDIQSQKSSTIRDFPPSEDCSMYTCTFRVGKFKELTCTKESSSKILLNMLCNRPDPVPAKLEKVDSKTDQSTLNGASILNSFKKRQSNDYYEPHEDIVITTTCTRSDSDKQDDVEPFDEESCNRPDPVPAKLEKVDSKSDQSTLNDVSILNSFDETKSKDYYEQHEDIDITTTYTRSDSDKQDDGEPIDEEGEDDETLFLGLIPEEIEVFEINLNIVSGIDGSPSQDSSIPRYYTKFIRNSPPSKDCSILMDREQNLDDISTVHTDILEEELYAKETFFKTLLGVLCNRPDPILSKLEKAGPNIFDSTLNGASTLGSFEKTQSNDNYEPCEDLDITTTYTNFDTVEQGNDKPGEKDEETLFWGLIPEEIEVENNLNVLSEVADKNKSTHNTEVFQPDTVDTDKTCIVVEHKDEDMTCTNNASPQTQFDRKAKHVFPEQMVLSPRQSIQDLKEEEINNDSHKAMLIKHDSTDVQLELVVEEESSQLSNFVHPLPKHEKNPLKINNSCCDDQLQIFDESNKNTNIKVAEAVDIANGGDAIEIVLFSGTEMMESIEAIESICDSGPVEGNMSLAFKELDVTRSKTPLGNTAAPIFLSSFSQESFESDDSEYSSDCDEGYDPDYDPNYDFSDYDSVEEPMGIISEMIAVACHCQAETRKNSEEEWMRAIVFNRSFNDSISSMFSSSFTLESEESDCSIWTNKEPGGGQDSANSISGSADKYAEAPNEEFSEAPADIRNQVVEVVIKKESPKSGDSVDTTSCVEATVEEFSQASADIWSPFVEVALNSAPFNTFRESVSFNSNASTAAKKLSENSQDTPTCMEDAIEECSQASVGQDSAKSVEGSADKYAEVPNEEFSQASDDMWNPYVEVVLNSDPSGVFRESVSFDSNVSVATKESSENEDSPNATACDTQKGETFISDSSSIKVSEMEDLIESLSIVSTKEFSHNGMTALDDERDDENVMKGCTSKKTPSREDVVTTEFAKSSKIRRFSFYEPIALDQNLLFSRQKNQIFKQQENKDSFQSFQDADLVSTSGSSINRAPLTANHIEDTVLQIQVNSVEHVHKIGGRKVLTPRQNIHENDTRLQTEKPVTYGSPLGRGYAFSGI